MWNRFRADSCQLRVPISCVLFALDAPREQIKLLHIMLEHAVQPPDELSIKRLIVVSLTLSLSLVTGCVHHYSLHSIQRSEQLDSKGSALISLPQDGAFETIIYHGSGHQTARAVASAFAKHLARVDIMPAVATLEEQLAAARSAGFDYLVTPSIAHWEDRATEWSGRPDRIEIELRTVPLLPFGYISRRLPVIEILLLRPPWHRIGRVD